MSIFDNVTDLFKNPRFSIRIRNAGVFQFPPEYKFQIHRHFDIEIVYVTSGGCTIDSGGVRIELKKDECIIIYPGVPHNLLVPGQKPCTIAQLEFNVQFPEKAATKLMLLEELSNKNCAHTRIYNCEEVPILIQKISEISEKICPNEFSKAKLELSLAEMFVVCSEKIEDAHKNLRKNTNRFDLIVQSIQNNINDELIIEDLCKECGVSSRYIRRKFNETMGMSANQYITMLRIAKAKNHLSNPEISITEIAMCTGFSNSQYFSRVFRASTGVTPTEYRKSSMKSKFMVKQD